MQRKTINKDIKRLKKNSRGLEEEDEVVIEEAEQQEPASNFVNRVFVDVNRRMIDLQTTDNSENQESMKKLLELADSCLKYWFDIPEKKRKKENISYFG